MLDVDGETQRVERLYRQITGTEPRKSESPVAPIPPDANPEQYVQDNLKRLQQLFQSIAMMPMGVAPGLPVVFPRITVWETDDEWRCAVELAGVKRADLTAQISQGVLNIHATRGFPGVNGEAKPPVYAECTACQFQRSVPLPPFAKCESAEAKLENGVLTVRLAKDPFAVRKDVKIEVA